MRIVKGAFVKHKNPEIDMRRLQVLEVKDGYASCDDTSYRNLGKNPKTYKVEDLVTVQ
jgi:hypothetical protein